MNRSYSAGVIILVAGLLILLGKFGVISFVWSMFWPIFILIPGALFHFLYFGGVLPAPVLVPGGILVTHSLMFFYCNLFGWDSMAYLWPGFILSVAVGLYEYYMFDRNQPRGVLVAATVLAIISAVFFGFTLLFSVGVYFIAGALIVIGILMMLRRSRAW